VQGGQLKVTIGSGTAAVTTPVTVPTGSTGGTVSAYGGNLTGWTNTPWASGQTYKLPTTVGYVR
jgi:hypothetical protein